MSDLFEKPLPSKIIQITPAENWWVLEGTAESNFAIPIVVWALCENGSVIGMINGGNGIVSVNPTERFLGYVRSVEKPGNLAKE